MSLNPDEPQRPRLPAEPAAVAAAERAAVADAPSDVSGDAVEVAAPTHEVAGASPEAALPGVHRGGYAREMTAPVEIALAQVPVHEEPAPAAPWQPPVRRFSSVFAGWALGFAVAGLAASLFVGWAFPLGIAGVATAIMALRRLGESRAIAVWAIVLSALSLVYSAGWLGWAATTGAL